MSCGASCRVTLALDHPFTRTVGGAYAPVTPNAPHGRRVRSPSSAWRVNGGRGAPGGTLTSLVLYRTPDGWRYAVHFTRSAGIAYGALTGATPSAEPDIALVPLVQKAGNSPTAGSTSSGMHPINVTGGPARSPSQGHFHRPEYGAPMQSEH